MSSQRVVRLNPGLLISSHEDVWYHFTFASGVFMVFESMKKNGLGMLELGPQASLPRLSERLKEVATVEPHIAQGVWKILGDRASLKNAKSILAASGHQIKVERELSPGTEILFNPFTATLRVSSAQPANRLTAQVRPAHAEKIRVMIVDDSLTIRKLLENLLSQDPEMEVVASVGDPLMVPSTIETRRPHVMTLDIHMPNKDGVTLLSEVFPKFRIPTLMVSALSPEDGPHVLQALEIGAIDYIKKPTHQEMEALGPMIVEKVRAAARANTGEIGAGKRQRILEVPLDQSTLVAIGSSTGGTEALRALLTRLPGNIPPIVITQHIPAVFSKALADRLNQLCDFEVREAVDGDEIKPGRVLIAPGGKQMRVKNEGGKRWVQVTFEGPVNRHAPSVDVLFQSVAKEFGRRSLGVILTGMGADGARGLLEMHQSGAYTIAQDEASSVVFGMPKEAIKLGAVSTTLDLHEMPEHLVMKLGQKRAAS